jgi:hypothetical protein
MAPVITAARSRPRTRTDRPRPAGSIRIHRVPLHPIPEDRSISFAHDDLHPGRRSGHLYPGYSRSPRGDAPDRMTPWFGMKIEPIDGQPMTPRPARLPHGLEPDADSAKHQDCMASSPKGGLADSWEVYSGLRSHCTHLRSGIIPTRRASEGNAPEPSLARRVSMGSGRLSGQRKPL